MSLGKRLFLLTRNFAFFHFLSGFLLFVFGWVWNLSHGILFGVPLFCYGIAFLISWDLFKNSSWGFVWQSIRFVPAWPLSILATFLTLNFLFCLLPPAELIEADSLLYNLTIPWQYYLRGGVVPLEWSSNDKFSMFLPMAQLPFVTLMFPWVVKVWNIFALPGLLIVFWQAAAWFSIEPRERYWLIAMLSSLVLFIQQYGTALFDIINTLYIFLGFYYLFTAVRERKKSQLLWGALFLGIACSLKNFFIYLSLVWILAYSVWNYAGAKRRLISFDFCLLVTPLLLGLLFVSPLFIRNYLMMGNPFFPLFQETFGPYIDFKLHRDIIDYARLNYGYGQSILDYVLMPFRMIWPFMPYRKFDYVTDPILILFLFGALYSVRRTWKTDAGLLFCIAFLIYTFLFFGSQQGRYFYPFWILAVLLGAPTFFKWFRGRWLTYVLVGQAILGLFCFFYRHRNAISYLEYLPKGSYLEHASFSYVWNQKLKGLETKQVCLRHAPGDTLIDLFYFTVPIKVLGHTTSILPFREDVIEECDRYMIGVQWPYENKFQPEGWGELVTKEAFIHHRYQTDGNKAL